MIIQNIVSYVHLLSPYVCTLVYTTELYLYHSNHNAKNLRGFGFSICLLEELMKVVAGSGSRSIGRFELWDKNQQWCRKISSLLSN
jgi:hypothetical protein